MLGTEASTAGKSSPVPSCHSIYYPQEAHRHPHIDIHIVYVTGYCPLSSKLRNFHEVCIHLVLDQFKIMIKRLFIAPH